MKSKLLIIITISTFYMTGCGNNDSRTVTVDTLTASSLNVYGRYLLTEHQNIELISSAVHFGYSFKGKECKIHAFINDKNGHNYLQYELDGVYQKRIKISGNDSLPYIITAPTDSIHTVWIYKATEAHTGPIFIESITGNELKALKKQDAPIIEFIGNSITCGAAADSSEVPCGQGEYHDQHNAYFSYAPRVARALNANFVLSSVSGIGIYRTWNMDGPSMPQAYEKTDFQINSNKIWDFSSFTPSIVSIALGTNDYSDGDGINKREPLNTEIFIKNYLEFIKLIKSKYPKAKIVLLSSPMINGEKREILQDCLNAIKEKSNVPGSEDVPVEVFFFQPMQAHGCSGHPSVEEHGVLAEELIPFFKGLLK